MGEDWRDKGLKLVQNTRKNRKKYGKLLNMTELRELIKESLRKEEVRENECK